MHEIPVRTRNWRSFEAKDPVKTSENDVASWVSAKACFEDWPLESEAGRARINANLDTLLEDCRNHRSSVTKLKTGELSLRDLVETPLREYSEWVVKIGEIQGEAWPKSLAELFLYDLFVIMNIANPGSFDLYIGQIDFDNKYPTELRLGASIWENAQFIDWPKSQVLGVTAVADWYHAVRPISGQVPQNPTERALFALMYMSRGNASPEMVLWIFYALESLFAARVGENRRVVIERISLLLGLDEINRSKLKKLLTKLYDMRSAFIHGGANINHPMQSEQLNRDASKQQWIDYNHIELGFAVILSCLQQMVIMRRINLGVYPLRIRC